MELEDVYIAIRDNNLEALKTLIPGEARRELTSSIGGWLALARELAAGREDGTDMYRYLVETFNWPEPHRLNDRFVVSDGEFGGHLLIATRAKEYKTMQYIVKGNRELSRTRFNPGGFFIDHSAISAIFSKCILDYKDVVAATMLLQTRQDLVDKLAGFGGLERWWRLGETGPSLTPSFNEFDAEVFKQVVAVYERLPRESNPS